MDVVIKGQMNLGLSLLMALFNNLLRMNMGSCLLLIITNYYHLGFYQIKQKQQSR